MKQRNIIFMAGLLICIFSITLIIIKGNPQDKVSFDSISEVVESALHHADKTGHILTSITDKEEMEVGDKIYRKIHTYYKGEKFIDTPVHKYVNDLGAIVSKGVKRKDIKYKFHILNAFYPNAFALPGGHIYVTMGLIAELESEAELAFILGHEITHVDAKHCIEAIQYKIAIEKIVGVDLDTYADIGYHIFLRPGYSEPQESEADIGGVYLTYRAWYHPLAVVAVFENICKAELTRKDNKTLTPIGDTVIAVGKMLDRYFATHPPAKDRIGKVKKYIKNNRIITEKSKFYVGQKNYIERKSRKDVKYKEEFKKDYILVKKDEKKKPKVNKYDRVLDELYTVYGRVYTGMSIADVKKILPKELKTSEKRTKIDYKNIAIYDFNSEDVREVIILSITLRNKKVKGIKLEKI